MSRHIISVHQRSRAGLIDEALSSPLGVQAMTRGTGTAGRRRGNCLPKGPGMGACDPQSARVDQPWAT